MPLQRRTDFVYCVSEVKWRMLFMSCFALLSVTMLEMYFLLIYLPFMLISFGWMIITKCELCFRRGTFSVAEFSVKLRRGSRIFCFGRSVKIICNFGMK